VIRDISIIMDHFSSDREFQITECKSFLQRTDIPFGKALGARFQQTAHDFATAGFG
jgi:hypothetical protein